MKSQLDIWLTIRRYFNQYIKISANSVKERNWIRYSDEIIRIDPNGERTKEMLKDILSKDKVLSEFVERIGRENLNRDAVMVELARVIGDLRADKVGLNAFLDMVAYAFQVGEVSAPTKRVESPRQPRKTIMRPRRAQTASARIETRSPRASISINLTISPDIPPERLKEYIKAMLEAYDEHNREG